METQFTWKTKFFSTKYEIYLYEMPAGELKKQSLSRRTYGELSDRKIMFETKGFFKPETQIIDLMNNSVIGNILIITWKRKSIIKYQNKEYNWQFDNFWNTKWSISNGNGILVKYHSHQLKGTIETYIKDEVLILAGFFLRNYFEQRSSKAAASS